MGHLRLCLAANPWFLMLPTAAHTADGAVCHSGRISLFQGLRVGATTKCAAFLGASQNHEIAYRIGVQLRNTREAVEISTSSKKKSRSLLSLACKALVLA
jgi:hypothetical protein